MTLTKTTAILRLFNEWQRGEGPLDYSPRGLINAIDAAVRMLERMRDIEVALQEIAWSNDSKWQADRARSVLEKSK